MKNLLAALFLICGLAARAQTFTPIHNYQQPDGLSVYKYFGVPYGPTPILNVTRTVPGAVFYNTTDSSLYSWTGVQWLRATGGVVISPSPGVDSITISGNVICQWRAGVSTCYALDRFFTDVALSADRLRYIYYNFMGDSLKTVDIPHTIAEQGAGMILTRRGDTVNFASSGTGGTVPKFTPTAVPFATGDSTLGEDQPGLNYNGTNLAVGHNNPNAPSGMTINGSRGLILADIGGLYISAGGNGTIGTPDATKHVKLQNNSNTLVDIYADGNTMVGLHANIKTDVLIDSLKTTGTAPVSAGTDRMVTTDINGKLSFAVIPTPGGSVSLTAGLGLAASPSTITGSGSFALDSASAVVLSRARAAATYQPLITGTGFVKSTAGTITYDNSTYQTSNQAVTVTATGDATGTSSASGTAPSIPLVLATVNSNVGSFTNASVTVNAKGLVTAVSSGAAGGTPDSSWVTGEFGTPYTTMGTLYDTAFQGTVIPPSFADVTPNVDVTFNNKMILSGGLNSWYNYVQTKYYNYDKQKIQFTVIPQTKTATDYGLGISFGRHTPSLFPNNDNHLVIKFDLSTGVDSGRISIGNDTTTFLKKSNPIAFNALDSLVLTFKREGWALTASMFNKTNGQLAEVTIYQGNGIGTGGQLRLYARSNGTVHVANFKATSWNRTNAGFVFIGASQLNAGASFETASWPSLVFKGNKSRYSTFGNPSITTDSMITAPLPEAIALGAKFALIEAGYNDYHYAGSDTTTFRAKYDTLLSRLIRTGVTPIVLNLVPGISAVNGSVTEASYNACIHNYALKYGLREVDVNTPLKNGGATIWLNYLSSDNVHLSDSGHIVEANAVIARISDLLTLYSGDSTSYLTAYNVPSGLNNMARLVVGADNKVYQVPSDFRDSASILFNHYNASGTGNFIAQKNTAVFVDGLASTDSALLLRGSTAGKINFAGRTTLIATNKPDNSGFGTPFAEYTRMTNSLIFDVGQTFATTHSLETGADLTLMGDNVGNTSQVGGNKTYNNIVAIGKNVGNSMTTSTFNVGIGSGALTGITTGSGVLHISNPISFGNPTAFTSSLSNAIVLGDATTYENYQNGDMVFATNFSSAGGKVWWGGRSISTGADYRFSTASGGNSANTVGGNTYWDIQRSSGLAKSPYFIITAPTPTTTGTGLQSAKVSVLQAEASGVTVGVTATTFTKPLDAVLNVPSTNQGIIPPNMTSAQRDAMATGAQSAVIATPGSGQTTGTWPLVFTGGTGTAPTGYAVVASGIATSVVIVTRGAMSVPATTVTIASGGTPATFTVTYGLTTSNTIYCTDCTATDASTGVMQTWNGTTWKNNW